jgi:hypothetical protein
VLAPPDVFIPTWIQSTFYCFKAHFDIILAFTTQSPRQSLLFSLLYQTLYAFLISTRVLYIRLSQSPWFDSPIKRAPKETNDPRTALTLPHCRNQERFDKRVQRAYIVLWSLINRCRFVGLHILRKIIHTLTTTEQM